MSSTPNLHASEEDEGDGDTASQKSISLSSPSASPRNSTFANGMTFDDHNDIHSTLRSSDHYSRRTSKPYTMDTDFSSETDDTSFDMHDRDSPNTTAPPSVFGDTKDSIKSPELPTYPPSVPVEGRQSVASFASTSSRKARPESMLVSHSEIPLILGIALVDFNHLVGPKIEYCRGEVFDNEEISKILPFLALPDGAHLSAEDYSYFHLVPSGPNPTTIFGISCNQQIATSALLVKAEDVTRSTVQKAVVLLVSKPLFGPVRDRLGVVTTALFNQRDFRETSILDDFEASLKHSLQSQLTESGLYMGTSLRELVHLFRQKILILVKAMMLQKRILFFGHPVERLCTYQYSLVSLFPGLLQTLEDCGSPPLATRAPTLTRPTSLRTSDRKSMMSYLGFPLDIFGKDAFFQPYLPLQQLDMLKESKSWLCGTTNSIVTQQKEIDILVNTETGAIEFRDPQVERIVALTAADRKWMDEVVRDVNDGWSEDSVRPAGMYFKGSDDYLRTKFEEYITAALSTVRYRDFIMKGEGKGVIITGGTGSDPNSPEDFNSLWVSEFKNTNAYEVWERTTDPMLFDIVEPRHPCNEKPSVVTDIGLRLQEGIQELKLEQQLAPAREAVARTITAGSTNFFKAMEGVREKWNQRASPVPSQNEDVSKASRSSTPVEISKADLDGSVEALARPPLVSKHSSTPPPETPTLKSAWGGFGSFISARTARFSVAAFAKQEEPEIIPKDITPETPLPPVVAVLPAASPIPKTSPLPAARGLKALNLQQSLDRAPSPASSPELRRMSSSLSGRVSPMPRPSSSTYSLSAQAIRRKSTAQSPQILPNTLSSTPPTSAFVTKVSEPTSPISIPRSSSPASSTMGILNASPDEYASSIQLPWDNIEVQSAASGSPPGFAL